MSERACSVFPRRKSPGAYFSPLLERISSDLTLRLEEIEHEVVVLGAQYYCLVTIVINANVDRRIPIGRNLYVGFWKNASETGGSSVRG